MEINLTMLPVREHKPRKKGITMVMDKGLSLREAEDLIDVAGHLIDYVKLGFGTSLFTGRVRQKAALYRKAGMKVYAGGTLFEAYLLRNQVDDYLRWIDHLGCDTIEVSDGSMEINHDLKCGYIREFAKNYSVLSEVGSKDASVHIDDAVWVDMTMKEIGAGSELVIAEARESGTVGIYDNCGAANTSLIDAIMAAAGPERIMWEAPLKSQQAWFINTLGADVNLGNIAPNEVIALETLRTGLRGDTFFRFFKPE
ncbi:MAG: phosphosulfolactate synthase [Bacteroidales bacterium]